MTIKEIDFQLIQEKAESKVFSLTNSDGTVYDMTDSSAICHLYLTPGSASIDITCTINVARGEISIPFLTTHTSTIGTFEYTIEETKVPAQLVQIVRGNIIVLPYVPFSESIEAYLRSELPANLTLSADYRNQRIMYWRRILQGAFNITDSNLNIESAWPTLVNALIAKLVVYDAMMLGARGSFMAFMGGDFTVNTNTGAPVKKIETGPTNVEFHSTSKSLREMFQPNANGYSAFTTIVEELCGLANFLKVKVPMCRGNTIGVTPKFYKNPKWDYPTLAEWTKSIETKPSQG